MQNNHDDDDSDDSFELESPPDSPLVERVVTVQTSGAASPVKKSIPRPVSPPPRIIEDATSIMPVELRSRQPLVQKPDNHLNQLPVPSTPKNRKPYAGQSTRVAKAEEVAVCQSVAVGTEVIAVEAAQEEEVVIIDREDNDLPSPEPASVKVKETFAVEIVSSRRSITPPLSNQAESQEEGVGDTGTDEEEEEEEDEEDDVQEIEEYDETVFLSPEKRGELHNEARRRGRAQGPALALNHPIISGLHTLNLRSPSITPTESIEPDTIPKTGKKPKGLITPPLDEIPSLHADSKVFTLLPVCDQPRIVSYTEYLQTISTDFSHIKKIGESSFAEVYIHKRGDGRSVVLKFVPLAQENNATEVLQELKTTRALSPIPGFIKYLGCQVVCSRVPPELESAWRVWEAKNNERYNPTDRVFGETTYHAIIALEDGGCSLDEARWSSWDIPLEIFRQTIKAFSRAEREREFEHRDLHTGNILVRDEVLRVAANANGTTKSCSRRSERINKPDWTLHCPRSNVIWLHFLIKRLIRSDDGRRNDGKLRIWKPSKAKKNQFDLACWEKVMKIHEVLDREVDDGWRFAGAVDIERWCEGEGLFKVLDEERERRNGAASKGKEGVVRKEKKEVVRRSARLRK